MISEKKALTYSLLATAGIIIVVLLIVNAPGIKRAYNNWRHDIQKADDATNYDTKKQVEDTCRAMIATYESDAAIFEMYKDSTDARKIELADQAMIRANSTASKYNNYIRENSYVWKDNVPLDINRDLVMLSRE
ncbi:MAG: hypothetical protein IKL53_08280 [Lachnospiraceae bacterium]|nr:hypothetical protein [Lachnospiraceae bacterium]